LYGIAEQHGTELPALVCDGDREASGQDGGDDRLAGSVAAVAAGVRSRNISGSDDQRHHQAEIVQSKCSNEFDMRQATGYIIM
jgi:hypothetical protein